MGDDVKAVEFVAEIRQVKTMADHTYNVTLNMPEYCSKQVGLILERHGGMVKGIIEFCGVLTDGQEQNGEQINKRTARNPLGVDSG